MFDSQLPDQRGQLRNVHQRRDENYWSQIHPPILLPTGLLRQRRFHSARILINAWWGLLFAITPINHSSQACAKPEHFVLFFFFWLEMVPGEGAPTEMYKIKYRSNEKAMCAACQLMVRNWTQANDFLLLRWTTACKIYEF